MSSLYPSQDYHANPFEVKHRSLNVSLVLLKYKKSSPTPISKENEPKVEDNTCKLPSESPAKQILPLKGTERPPPTLILNKISKRCIPLKASTPVGRGSRTESSPGSNIFTTINTFEDAMRLVTRPAHVQLAARNKNVAFGKSNSKTSNNHRRRHSGSQFRVRTLIAPEEVPKRLNFSIIERENEQVSESKEELNQNSGISTSKPILKAPLMKDQGTGEVNAVQEEEMKKNEKKVRFSC